MNFTAPDRRVADDLAFLWHPGLLAALLRCDRLTIVHAAPGTTRDAMLQRVLLPLLGRRAIDRPLGPSPPQPPVLPIVEQRRPRPVSRRGAELVLRFDAWGDAPLMALRERIAATLPMAWSAGAPATLADHLHEACRAHDVQLLLVLDAFERHLAQPQARSDIARFDGQLIDWIRRDDVPAHVLLLVDGAHEARLQRYAAALPEIGHGWLRAAAALPGATATPAQPVAPSTKASPAPSLRAAPASTKADPATPPAPAPALAPALAPLPVHAPVPASATLEIRATPDDHLGGTTRGLLPPELPAVAPMSQPITALRERIGGSDSEPPVGKAPRRWPLRVANAALGVAAAWMLGVWLLGQEDPGVRTLGHAPDVAAPPPALPAPTGPPAAPPSPAPTGPAPALSKPDAAPPTANAQAPAVPAPADRGPAVAAAPPAIEATPAPPPSAAATPDPALRAGWRLTIARPVEGGSAAVLIDELARRVAAPAGISLQYAAPGAAAALAVWRHDALVAAREDGRDALRVLAPLYNEQIQVLVRADSRWRWLHQLQGLHLNVGAAGGARARTADTLYRRLYGRALPAWDTDDGDETTGLRRLLGDRSIDALFIVAGSPVLAAQPPAVRDRLRVLQLDPRHRSTAAVLRSYLSLRGPQPNEPPVLAVTSFLVSPTAPAPEIDPALRALVSALCRARPTLQAQASHLLRGIDPRLQPAVGWPYLVPTRRDGSTDCPAPPPAR